MNANRLISALLGLLFIRQTLGQQQVDQVNSQGVQSFTPAVRAKALSTLRDQVRNSPRAAATQFDKTRILDTVIAVGEYDTAAQLALACANAQPDRLDRAELFLAVRIKALLAAKRNEEALAAAKSFYNVVPLNSTGKAIDFVSQALAATYPDDPAKIKRFKLQQLANIASAPPSNSLGESVLASVKVDESIYDGHGLFDEHNADWQWVGQGNLLLMKDKPAQAKVIFEKLLKVDNIQVREAAQESLARCAKAEAGCVGPGNQVLISFRQAASTQP